MLNPRSLHDQLLYPHACFSALHQKGSVVYNEEAKCWEVFDYDLVRHIASESEIFSSEYTRVKPVSEDEEISRQTSMLGLDPPRHNQLRALVSQAFTPRTIVQLAPRIAEISRELLDTVASQEHMDIIDDFSAPLPVIVISEMLGVPASDREQFKQWSDELIAVEYDEIIDEAQRKAMIQRIRQTVRKIEDYFRQVLAERRRQPQNDLISALLAAQIEGQSLTEEELLGFCTLLLVAGNITTTNLIGNALLCFDEHPEVMEHLHATPELVPSAIEEVLRYRSPAVVIVRYPLSDVTVGDQHIKRGETIMAWLACANHDPAQFPDAERFDVERNPNKHLAFGHGLHFCLGAPLARLESKIALEIVLQRFDNIRRVSTQNVDPVSSSFIYGIKHLPVTFSVRS
ncbi:MAG TPA: cytochrome P450 [Ktedonobacteraceae bacterium]|nr:cytochrome P450 [Ktedonobacteraceae bacterium]